MASGAEINSSLGEVGRPEKRSFGREYITWSKPINNASELVSNIAKFLPHTVGARRFVMRGLLSEDAIKTAKKLRLPIEAGIEMKHITGNDDGSAIIYFAKNRHMSPPSGR